MKADGRFDGHVVQGHVDGVGRVRRDAVARRVGRDQDRAAPELERYLVEKGSVSVDGISLTVWRDLDGAFSVALIPYTLAGDEPAGREGRAASSTSRPTSSPSTWSACSRRRAVSDGASQKGPCRSATIPEALEDIRAGSMLVVVDDEDRENEGDLTIAAEKVTPEAINFMARYGRGLVCLPMTGERLDELRIPLMVRDEQNKRGSGRPSACPIEARKGTTTGISAADRATHGARGDRPADPAGGPRAARATCSRCGRCRAACSQRAGQTEAAVDLARLAGLYPAGVICEIMNEDGTMARVPQLEAFCREHGHPDDHDPRPDPVPDADTSGWCGRSPRRTCRPRYGGFRIHAFESLIDGQHHVALVMGEVRTDEPVLVRVHSQCLTGDIFASTRCDCGDQLHTALELISAEGRGRAALPAPGGARHRPRPQDHGLRAAGPGQGHRGGQRGARLQGRPARLRDRGPDPGRARRPEAAPHDQQPPQVRGPRGLRARDRPSASRSRCRPRTPAAATSRRRRRSSGTSCAASDPAIHRRRLGRPPAGRPGRLRARSSTRQRMRSLVAPGPPPRTLPAAAARGRLPNRRPRSSSLATTLSAGARCGAPEPPRSVSATLSAHAAPATSPAPGSASPSDHGTDGRAALDEVPADLGGPQQPPDGPGESSGAVQPGRQGGRDAGLTGVRASR